MEADTKHMTAGLLWFVGGIVFTLITYTAAGGRGIYVVATGAIVFGLLQFLYGLVLYARHHISRP
jgi:hypothetical protein